MNQDKLWNHRLEEKALPCSDHLVQCSDLVQSCFKSRSGLTHIFPISAIPGSLESRLGLHPLQLPQSRSKQDEIKVIE